MVAEEYVFGETRRVSLCLQRGHCIDIGRHWRENSTGKSVIGISSSENRTIQNENGPQGPVIFWSGRRDLNPQPLCLQTGIAMRLSRNHEKKSDQKRTIP